MVNLWVFGWKDIYGSEHAKVFESKSKAEEYQENGDWKALGNPSTVAIWRL